MKRLGTVVWAVLLVVWTGFGAASAADPKVCKVTLDRVENGTVEVEPPLPESREVPAGTELTLKAKPAAGFAVDSVYHIGFGSEGRMFYETARPEWKLTINSNQRLGASFIERKALEGFTVRNDVVFAQPGVKKLKYDVYMPDNARNLPCIVIIHGGGWAVNNEDVMRGLARDLVRGGKYVVASIDYRWIGNGDGDGKAVTMVDIIEDVFGGIVHVQEHAAEYGADPTRLAVTGDSAGGHLSAAAIDMADRIGDGGFGVKPGVYQFKPTYVPKGKSIEQVRTEVVSAIKAAAPSYGVFSKESLSRFTSDLGEGAQYVAPQSNIPGIKERAVPQFLLRGTADTLIRDAAVQAYADALRAAGQRAEYVLVPGIGHAFLDWKPDPRVKGTYARFGAPYAIKMREFFDSVFYPAARQ